MMMEQRNLIAAILLSIAIVLGFQFLVEAPRLAKERARQQALQQTTGQTAPPAAATGAQPQIPPAGAVASAPTVPGVAAAPAAAPAAAGHPGRAEVLAESPRIAIASPSLKGSISLKGARIDDLKLGQYRETVDPKSPEIVLFTPPGMPDAYYAEFGWVASGAGVKLPDANTLWQAERTTLTPATPVTLTWDNGQGLKFERTYAIDDAYMVQVTQKVENSGSAAVTLYPYGLVSRSGDPPTSSYYILHEGPLGVLDGVLHDGSFFDKAKIDYKDLQKTPYEQDTTGGWLGFTDKYWLVALIPNQKVPVRTRFSDTVTSGNNKYQADYVTTAGLALEPGQTITAVSRMFAGAKEVHRLDSYEQKLGIERLSYAIDWGWYWFFTKPIFYLLDYLNKLVGNFGIAILLLTVIIKGLFFPLANKSYRSMSKLKKLQPEMMKIRERFKDDRERMNKEMMELYKREKANPASGCLPMVIQIPVFFSLYKVLFVTIEMRQAPFFGWIRDLSVPDPTSLLNLFGLVAWTPPEFLNFLSIGIWPLIMGATMWAQQKLNPAPPDPVQAKMFMVLPLVFTFMLARFPSGLVIYWAWNNCLSILQQWVIMRRAGVKP
ncbi:MAG TPA: membrane protein insertase YidC [Alphaproteobacteria bacterium]|nr:membrane protein insertase YidC [Alphaproteobacteria bacterium]